MRAFSAFRLLLPFVLVCLGLPVRADDAMLRVESLKGLVQVERGGERFGLHEGEAVQARDLLSTDATGHVSLAFSRYGFIELGSNAQLRLDALPESSYRGELKTVFALLKGYLRVVWKRPPSATVWPIYVVMDQSRAVLGSGEYFFQQGEEQRACSAAGVFSLQIGSGSDGPEQVRPPACARIKGNSLAVQARDSDDWRLVRNAFSVQAGEPVLTEVEASSAVAARKTLDAPVPLTSSADMPPPKPGFDYSLLEGQPGPAATEPVPAPSTPKPQAPVPAPAPAPAVVAVAPTVKGSAFEVSKSPEPVAPAQKLPALSELAPSEVIRPGQASPSSGKPLWRINVGSSTDATEARGLLVKVQAQGLTARLSKADIRGREWFRVQVGGYATADAAKADSARVSGLLGLPSVWVGLDK